MKFFSHGILGMNARNLRYIRAKNSAESISLADSKLKTKNFLSSRGIPFAETYATLSNHQELTEFSLSSIPTDHFVIKPNKGSRGRGIIIVKRAEDGYIVDGSVWTEDEVKLHMTDILHGSFSLHGSSDTIVVEELLAPGNDFAPYCEHGLADIRVIVYNYVPVTAMIRMPTAHSGGKANLSQGGIGLGLNIASGQIISLFQNKAIHTQVFPAGHEGLKGRTLPFWDDVLLFSSQIQMYTKLGYLALDWVITKNGPKLLEINARAGLEIQNVNLVPLASRLRKIEDIRILTPEKGVEVAKTLFYTGMLSSAAGKKILCLEQTGTVGDIDMVLSVDLGRSASSVSKDLAETAGSSGIRILTDLNVSVTLKKFDIDHSGSGRVVLGKDDMQNFLLQPVSRLLDRSTDLVRKWTQELIDFDNEVYRIGKKVNLSPILRPDNYFAALDAFIQDPHGYNPVFSYRFPSQEKLDSIRNALGRLTDTAHAFRQSGMPIADLYIEKLSENGAKLGLIEACRNEDIERVRHFNSLLFGETDEKLFRIAKEKVLEMG